MYIVAGIPMALLRINEPYVWNTLKNEVRSLCNCGKKDSQAKKIKKYSSESLDTFINSAMNIELVYLILLGINQFHIFKDSLVGFSSTAGENKIAPSNEKTKIRIVK